MEGRVTMRLYPKPELKPIDYVRELLAGLNVLARISWTSSSPSGAWRVTTGEGTSLDTWVNQVARVLELNVPAQEAMKDVVHLLTREAQAQAAAVLNSSPRHFTPGDLQHLQALVKAIDQKKITTEMAPWSPLARAYLTLRDAADYVVKLHDTIPQPRF